MKATFESPQKAKKLPHQLFSKIANERGAAWLDSSLQVRDKGRFSYIARRPVLETSANPCNLNEKLRELSSLWKDKYLFSVGYISYEGTLPLIGAQSKFTGKIEAPFLHFLFYQSVLKFDHLTGTVEITNPAVDNYSDLFADHDDFANKFSIINARVYPAASKTEYLQHVNAIKKHIKEGDIYQANYTCRYEVHTNAHPFRIYENLRELNPAPYSAYLNFGDYQIISSSPERMFSRDGDFITCCPIKGTVPRGNSNWDNNRLLQKLLNSTKDHAELLMIVDLMRNDLGKIAQTGSVIVSNLFTAEPYSSLIHLVTDVSATLKSGIDYYDILKALMPGGSITGAPKKSAVEILQQHESSPRGVYTGCIGYANRDEADFNIAIRTIMHKNGVYYVHAGGGIVADSDPKSEYEEMQLKARNLFKALGVHSPN